MVAGSLSSHSPVKKAIRTSIRFDSWKQWSSKCSEHRRESFGRYVLPMARLHARRKLLSFRKLEKRKLGILLGFWLITALKSYAMSRFAGKNPKYETTEQPLHASHQNWLADFEGRKKINTAREIILRTKYLVFDTFTAFSELFALRLGFALNIIPERLTTTCNH